MCRDGGGCVCWGRGGRVLRKVGGEEGMCVCACVLYCVDTFSQSIYSFIYLFVYLCGLGRGKRVGSVDSTYTGKGVS